MKACVLFLLATFSVILTVKALTPEEQQKISKFCSDFDCSFVQEGDIVVEGKAVSYKWFFFVKAPGTALGGFLLPVTADCYEGEFQADWEAAMMAIQWYDGRMKDKLKKAQR
jgi:hypothetical protein